MHMTAAIEGSSALSRTLPRAGNSADSADPSCLRRPPMRSRKYAIATAFRWPGGDRGWAFRASTDPIFHGESCPNADASIAGTDAGAGVTGTALGALHD